MKHTRCRPLQRSSTISAWLHQLAVAMLIIVNGSLIYAAPCQPTKAADTGTSIWTIADIAQAAVGGPTNLDLVAQPRIINQAQVDAGTVVISESGRYIVCEELVDNNPNSGATISIEVDNVTLLLNGHSISKAGGTGNNTIIAAGRLDSTPISNIVVKGGTLIITSDGASGSLNAVRFGNALGVVNNGVIKDIQIFGTSQGTSFSQRGIQIIGSSSITVSNITNSQLTDGHLYTNASAIVTRDCITSDSPGIGFEATTSGGSASDALFFKRCTSERSQLSAFIIFDATDTLLDQCYSIGGGSSQGFLLDRVATTGILNGYTRDCIADNPSGDGFVFGSGATNIGAISCIAFNAAGDGFRELNTNATATFYRCTSHHNGGDGFDASGVGSVAIYNCLGFDNSGSDFVGAAAGTVFSSATQLGPNPGSGFMTNTTDNPGNGGVINDFWPNLST